MSAFFNADAGSDTNAGPDGDHKQMIKQKHEQKHGQKHGQKHEQGHQNNVINQKTIFISGDALYSFVDARLLPFWKGFQTSGDSIFIDSWEKRLMGINLTFPNISYSELTTPLDFWKKVCEYISQKVANTDTIGFFQMEGPYMFRSSVYANRLMRSVLELNLIPEYYTYLDGVHTGHAFQSPSEFENIGNQLDQMRKDCEVKGKDFIMLACERCGKARGYFKEHIQSCETDQSASGANDLVIPGFKLCNLNRIIERFKLPHIILSPDCGLIINPNYTLHDSDTRSPGSPTIILFITHSPYGSEWSFGAISFALASANNHGIKVTVIFIEDGVYNLLYGEVQDADRLFNVSEVISAFDDVEGLEFYYHRQSAEMRGVDKLIESDKVLPLDAEGFRGKFLESSNGEWVHQHQRIYFF